MSVYDGVAFVLVVDDDQTPSFRPRTLFEIEDPSIPGDWIVNLFQEGPVQLVVGPRYIANDLDSYNATVDQREPQMREFWKRIDAERLRPIDEE